MEPSAFYDQVIERLSQEEKRLKKREIIFAIGRGAAMLSALVSFYLYFIEASFLFIPLGVGLLVVFGIVLKLHVQLRERLSHNRAKLKIAKSERAYLDGDLGDIEDGFTYRDESHAYANDLDIFGPGSLFQRLSRCKTTGGKDALANEMNDFNWEHLTKRQNAVREFSTAPEKLLEYRAILERLDHSDIKGKVKKWLDDRKDIPLLYKQPLSIGLAALLPLALAATVVLGNWSWLNILPYFFLLNLIILGQGSRFMRKQYQQLDRIHKDTEVYARLISEFIAWELQNEALQELKQRLEREGRRADEEFRALGRILERFDTMNNIVALILLNGMFLFHVHVANALVRWKRRNADLMVEWLRALDELEGWVSKGQFYFHHPTYSFPKLQDGMHFEAKGIGHPFLPRDKRVDNDVVFDGFKIIVLTGSNMAGKSTFLRSIGVNIVLAALGLPVCASGLNLSPFQLLSSMKPQDSINDDRSYFQAEVLRLRMILDRIEGAQPSFVLFDEILRGTNSDDKRNGTRAFLDGLADKKLLGVIATHDIEIADSSDRDNSVFKNFFFESTFSDGELHFDYRLREGVCRTPNATQLLKKYRVI